AARIVVCGEATVKSVAVVLPCCPMTIDAGGQVVKVAGRAFVPETLAFTWAVPGRLAVTTPFASIAPTVVSETEKLTGPTVELMSLFEESKAEVKNTCVWPWEVHPLVAVPIPSRAMRTCVKTVTEPLTPPTAAVITAVPTVPAGGG